MLPAIFLPLAYLPLREWLGNLAGSLLAVALIFWANVGGMNGGAARIAKENVRTPALFKHIQTAGDIPERDMFNTFNMGVGMILVVAKEDAQRAVEILKKNGEDAWVLGEIASGDGVELC